MFRLKTIAPDQASGEMAQAYSVFPPQVGVPLPLQLMSASPQIAILQSGFIKYFMGHPNLNFRLLALIRYLAAADQGYAFCTGFNGNMLKMTGLDDVNLEAIAEDPATAPLEPKDQAMLVFVAKALRTPDQVEDADIQPLRDLGWADSDIFDALFHGAAMRTPAVLMKALTDLR
jgi:hypothetical protein